MEVDGDIKPEVEANQTENVPLSNAVKAVDSLVREQKSALSSTLEGFVNCLTSTCPASAAVLGDENWDKRDEWDSPEWIAWETWSWYRHFCRFYAPYLRNYQTTLSTVCFAQLEGSTDPRAELVKRIWNVTTGQES
jgi:nuclear cap-binding protein subunit 1